MEIDPYNTEQMKQIEALKRQLLIKILTKDAYERLGRVRMVDPNTANNAELYILQVYQAGKIEKPLNDDQMKEILKLLSQKKDINISRK